MIFVGYQLFEIVRTRVTGSATSAARNARTIVRIERATWTYHEHALQQWVLPHRYLVEGLDLYYGTIHFVIPPLVLAWLWRRFSDRYERWRNALVITTLLALVGFAVYPLTPPRLMPPAYGFVDTLRVIGGQGPLDSNKFKDLNPFAAMPSLHLAWSTWCACALASTVRRRWLKVAVFAYPAMTLFVVMTTANHWFVDAVGGWAVLAAGWWLAGLLPAGRRVALS
jgi:PAP2 superfamily